MKRNAIVAASVSAGIVALLLVGGGVFVYSTTQTDATRQVKNETVEANPPAPPETAEAPGAQALSESEQLLYLIEEEKLAHDVYATLGSLWGANIFANIQASEISHQEQVAALLPSYGLADPRSAEVGVFVNSELQELFDQLIAQGSQSMTEALKVGVLIEEKDIADLQDAMSATQDPSILRVLETLKRGSENHLKAFNRQLG